MKMANSEKTLLAVSLLREIAQAIAKSGPDSALKFLLESAISISEACGAMILTPHEKLREMVPLIEQVSPTQEKKQWEVNFPEVCYQLFLDDQACELTREQIREKLPELSDHIGPALAMPVRLAGQTLGLFFIYQSPTGSPFETDNQSFFEILTPFMGTLLENSRLHTEMLHKNSRLSALYDISTKAESIIDLRDVYESLEEVVRSFIKFDAFMIYFLNADGQSLEARKLLPRFPFPQTIKMGEGPVGLAVKERKPQLTYSEEFKSILILPVVVSGKFIGVVTIASRKSYAYRDEDIIGLRIITTQVASIDEMFKDLLRLRGFTQHILQSMNSGVLIFDCNGNVSFSNSAMTHVLGQPVPETWSFSSAEAILPEKVREMMQEVLNSRGSFENLKVVIGEGSTRQKTLEVNAFPFRDESGIMLGTAFFFKDITQVIRLEEQLKRADRLSALGVLAAGVAHEIRNPLTGMKMIVQLLMSEFPKEDSKREPLHIIQNEIDRLERIIVNLLDFARPSKPQEISFALPDVVNACLLLVKNQITKIGLSLEKHFPELLPALIGDPDQLKQVFLNILTNAVQASKPSGKLSVTIEEKPGWLITAVSDTGIGIPSGRLRTIFDPFVTTKDDGTGLGLSVALRIVEEHGGRIEVESEEGVGTTFSVFLPLKT